MTQTQSGTARAQAALALQHLQNREFASAYGPLSAVVEALPDDSPLRENLTAELKRLYFFISTEGQPPESLQANLLQLAQAAYFQFPEVKPVQPLKPRETKASGAKKLGPIGALLAFLAKFKTIGLLLATKGKLILLALTNFKAVFSILAFVGIYWALYGWWFAVGFFASIFIHEMGHYITVRRYGYSANAPVFVPLFGAYVKWQGAGIQTPTLARISLAGPLYGLFSGIAAFLIYQWTGNAVWLAVAHAAAFINLFNLIPISIFDGGSAFYAVGRQERIAVAVVAMAMFFFLTEFMFLFIGLGAAYRAWRGDYPGETSQSVAYYFIGLMLVLGLFDWFLLQSASSVFPGMHPLSRGLAGNSGAAF